MAEIDKTKNEYNTYRMKLSYGELVALEQSLGANRQGPVADELYGAIKWYLDELPKPGAKEDDKGGSEDDSLGGEGDDTILAIDDLDAGGEAAEDDEPESFEDDEFSLPDPEEGTGDMPPPDAGEDEAGDENLNPDEFLEEV